MRDQNYPAMKWHPETGEPKVCQSAGDVPEGYLDTHPSNLPKDAPKPTAQGEIPMTKDEVMSALKAGGIAFKPQAGLKTLYGLLVAAIKEHLDAAKVEYPENASAPELLALVPKSE